MANEPTLIIDSRENLPWSFPDGVRTERRGLPEGDYAMVGPTGLYSIDGMERRVVLERKSLGDFVSTVINQWIRFRKELNRLSGYDAAAIVVEATLGDVLAHRYESRAVPAAVTGRAHAIELDHGIAVHFWGPREEAQVVAYQWLRLAWEKYGER